MTWYNFVTVDVFTTTPYEGNPLAIVLLPKDSSITQDQKDKVAKEFNLSETVFLHEDSGASDGRRFDIFTILGEIPWYVLTPNTRSEIPGFFKSHMLTFPAGRVEPPFDEH